MDLSSYNLDSSPYVYTSLDGDYWHWKILGMSNIYNLTKNGFRVYLSGANERDFTELTVSVAQDRNYKLMYMVVPNSRIS